MDMVDGYIIENLLPIWGKGHLILIEMLGSTASEQDNLSKKVFYYLPIYHKQLDCMWQSF